MAQNFESITEGDLRFLNELALKMAEAADEPQVLDIILSAFIKKIGAEVGAFVHLDPDEDSFEIKSKRTANKVEVDEIYFSSTVFKKIRETKEAVLSFDTLNEEEFSGSRQILSFFAPVASLTLENIISRFEISSENYLLKQRLEKSEKLPQIIGESTEIKKMSRIVHKVAQTDASVIITGENGTGKDLVAQAIHELSPRKEKPFIAQFVGNIPSTILESELFGYKKGAFTGATTDKIGLFEAVNGGTIFLDEIAELSPDLQSKLLRVLQNKEIKRLGENIIRKIDVRILAATNRNLKQMIAEGKFREDLYYRLNVITINVPALRERRDDIPILVKYFLQESGNKKASISSKALKKLMAYNWPGNVRQLKNFIERILILTTNNKISEEDIIFEDEHDEFEGTMEEFKNLLIKQRIKQFNGNKTLAAKSLDISLRSLQLKAKELGI